MSSSTIEWTEQTWNPVTGCTKVSPGCKNCYAEAMANRLQAMKVPGYERGFEVSLHPSRLEQPMQRKRPTIYFVNSMSDLFHEDVPDVFLDRIFGVIERTPQHTYQILTKQSQRLPIYFRDRSCPRNVWLGVSVENRKYGVPRIEHLRQVEAHTRFMSVEPLLADIGSVDLSGIHWVIVGGESGPKARAMSPAWVDAVRLQCENQSVAFFFKQWGGWGADGVKRNKKTNGRLLHGRTWDALPVRWSIG